MWILYFFPFYSGSWLAFLCTFRVAIAVWWGILARFLSRTWRSRAMAPPCSDSEPAAQSPIWARKQLKEWQGIAGYHGVPWGTRYHAVWRESADIRLVESELPILQFNWFGRKSAMDCFPKFVDPADNFLCCLPLGVGAKAKICVISLAFLFKQSKHIFDHICIQDVYTVYTSSDSPSNLKGVASVAVCCSHCHISLTAPDVAALGSGAVHSSNGALVCVVSNCPRSPWTAGL